MLANVGRLSEAMKQRSLDALIASTPENVQYLTGVQSVALHMFPHDDKCHAVITADDPGSPFFICSRCEIDQALEYQGKLRGTVSFGTFYREMPHGFELNAEETRLKRIAIDGPSAAGPVEAIVLTLQELGLDRGQVGIDERGLHSDTTEQLASALPNLHLTLASDVLTWARKVKTDEELRRIIEASRLTEWAILEATSIAQEGVTESAVARVWMESVVHAGGVPRFCLVRFGRNGVAGQVRPGATRLRRGDTIWFDVGATWEGYWADVARTCCLGEPSNRVRAYHAALVRGEQEAIDRTRPGMTGNEVFALTIEATQRAGLSHYRRHHVGHGIGLEVYEPPLLSEDDRGTVEAGMIVNVETPYYEFGLGALHVEDPIVVGLNGNRRLTASSQELIVL